VRARLDQRPQDAATERQPDHDGHEQDESQHARRHHDDPFKRSAGPRDGGLAVFTGIGLVGVHLLDVRRAAGGQRLVRQLVHLDAVPALYCLAHGQQGLVGECRVCRQHLAKQGSALFALVRVREQPGLAGGGLLEQRIRLAKRFIARFFEPAFHGGLGVRQRGTRLEQPAGHVGKVAGPFDAASPQGFDVCAVVAQHGDTRRRGDGEQHHKQRENGRQRCRDPQIFPHIRPCVASPPVRQ